MIKYFLGEAMQECCNALKCQDFLCCNNANQQNLLKSKTLGDTEV